MGPESYLLHYWLTTASMTSIGLCIAIDDKEKFGPRQSQTSPGPARIVMTTWEEAYPLTLTTADHL